MIILKKRAIVLLFVFLAGMSMFAVAESYGKPDHPIGRFIHFCYGNYTVFCLSVHLIAWLGGVLFLPVAIAGYIYRFSSSLDYYSSNTILAYSLLAGDICLFKEKEWMNCWNYKITK
jgi:hypothetical protein